MFSFKVRQRCPGCSSDVSCRSCSLFLFRHHNVRNRSSRLLHVPELPSQAVDRLFYVTVPVNIWCNLRFLYHN